MASVGVRFFRLSECANLNGRDTKQGMAAPATVPAWHGELKCATVAAHAEAVCILQQFLDSDGTELNINGRKVTALPPGYFALAAVRARLVVFRCPNNALTAIPASLGKLTALERFYCNHNALTSLPADLGQLTALMITE